MIKLGFLFLLSAFSFLVYPSPTFAAWSKYANNPVLNIDQTQSWESNSVDRPSLIYEDNLFKMWYSGNNAGYSHVGYAEGNDGVIFSRHPNNPIIAADIFNSNDIGIDGLSIVKHNNIYHGWFARISNNPIDFDIYHTSSNDGFSWDAPTLIILNNSTTWDSQYKAAPAVIYNQNLQIYELWYTAFGSFNGVSRWRIGYATSTDGTNWNKHLLPVLEANVGWEGSDVGDVGILYENGVYYIWYHGANGIGQATSSDGINWTKDPNNPILTPDPDGFDSKRVLKPFVIKKENLYYLYYAGIGNDDKWRIGLATSDSLPTPSVTPTGTPTPTPAPTVTPTPPGPDKSPIVLVVSMGGSWNGRDFMSCDINSSHQWKLNPYISTYNRLIKTLKNKLRLKQNKDFYVYTYDWRQTLEKQDEMFETFVNDIFANHSTEARARVVAHSFGGLVVRSYLEKRPDNHLLSKVLTVGTPHEGSTPTYPLWSAGDVLYETFFKRSLFATMINHCRRSQNGTGAKRLALRANIPSIQQMLPLYQYITLNGSFTPVNEMNSTNNWLPVHPFPADQYTVAFSTLSGDETRTVHTLAVRPPSIWELADGDWLDGRPIQTIFDQEGDGTVLQQSSILTADSIENKIISQNHESLMYSNEGIRTILDFLGFPQAIAEQREVVPEVESQRMMSITTDQPAMMDLTDKKRKRIRSDDQLLIAYNPQKDTYTLTVVPNQTGIYNFQITITNTAGETLNAETTRPLTRRKMKRFFLKYDPGSSAPPVLIPQ